MPAKKRTSKPQPKPAANDEPPVLAIVGLVTALIIAPVGLVISIIVLTRNPDRAAKIMAIIGVAFGAFSTIVFGLAIALVASTTSEIQTKAHDIGIRHDLQSVQIDLEESFSNSPIPSYPTLNEFTTLTWRTKNSNNDMSDPNWSILEEYVFVSGTPTSGQMSYQPSPDGCQDTAASPCTGYTLSSVPLGPDVENTVHSLGD